MSVVERDNPVTKPRREAQPTLSRKLRDRGGRLVAVGLVSLAPLSVACSPLLGESRPEAGISRTVTPEKQQTLNQLQIEFAQASREGKVQEWLNRQASAESKVSKTGYLATNEIGSLVYMLNGKVPVQSTIQIDTNPREVSNRRINSGMTLDVLQGSDVNQKFPVLRVQDQSGQEAVFIPRTVSNNDPFEGAQFSLLDADRKTFITVSVYPDEQPGVFKLTTGPQLAADPRFSTQFRPQK